MAIGNFTELKTALETWLERAGDTVISGNAADFVTLGEARMNRDLIGLRMTTVNDTTLTGTVGSRQLTLPTNFLSPIALFLTTYSDQRELRPFIVGSGPLSTTNGAPSAWGINADKIDLDRPADAAHTFSLRYHKKLDIAADTTNWLLTNFPDVYLYACLTEAAILLQDYQAAAGYETVYDQRRKGVSINAAQSLSRVQMTVDPVLTAVSGRRGSDFSGFSLGE